MSFKVPYSSSPPSTPDRRSNNGFSFGANPSTTPAGPPPSSTGSFTPAGPPPSSVFGSSMMGSTPLKPLSFSQQTAFNPASSPPASYRRSGPPTARSGLSHEYQASPQQTFQSPSSEGEEEDEYQEDGRFNDSQRYAEEDADGMTDEDVQYEEDTDMDGYGSESQGSRTGGHGYSQRSDDLLRSTPGSLKRSREGGVLGLGDSITQSVSRPDTSIFESIAKDLYTQMPVPPLTESDDLILSTEAIFEKLYEKDIGVTEDDEQVEEALISVSKELIQIWEDYRSKIAISHSEEYSVGIGPGPRASDFEKANFLAGLALQMQHPEKITKTSFDRKVKPLPQSLLEWIDEKHNLYPSQFEEVATNKPSPSNHPLFWDTIFSALLRGKVLAVVDVLRNAGWRTARTETENSQGQFAIGFSGPALSNVEKVINAAIKLLSDCPPAKGDWNIRNSQWTVFRLRVSQTLEQLRSYAEGTNRDRTDSMYGPEGFGTSSIAGTYSQTAQRAESKVPWHIYQNLVTMYTLVMGDTNAIIENAQDWVEATIGLLVWWDEGKDDRRVALGRSQSTYRAASRETDAVFYRRKLRRAFQTATAEGTELEVQSADEVEIGLASLFEGDFEAVVGFFRGWSGPVSAAVAEVASLGGWLPQTEENNLINMGSLDQDDMDVLGYNSSPSKVDGVKDKTLITYARSLAQRGELKATKLPPQTTRYGPAQKEGWELAIAVLGRLDSNARSEEMIGDFLKGFRLDSSETVDKLWKLLNQLDMSRHAEDIAEIYADTLAEGSHRYGEALWYYSLSHKNQKVKDVLDLLISFSLIQSTAYPPDSELDDYLRSLVSSPKKALTELSGMDLEAAELLHKLLSGYATLRKFYDLRDEELSSTGNKSQLGPIARKVEAASSLLAVITSSDDNIRGGLYDEERGAVVSVDFLLALLGEALVFVNQQDYTITVSQIDILLKAIEDLQAVGPRVYSACTEFLQTVVASGQGLKGSSPTDMLRKSTSNASGTSGSFLLVGSSMLASQLKQSMSSSGVLVRGNIKRGWDWRHGISAGTSGDEVLRMLRLGLAKDLAKAYLLESDSRI